MGYQTDYLGYFAITPQLDVHDIRLINHVSGCLPIAADPPLRQVDEALQQAEALKAGGPRGWSSWAACPTGCCLSYDGGDKANHMIPWLGMLMDEILVPGGHVLNGMVVGARRDNGELFAMIARENEVEIEMLWPGDPSWSEYPPLAHQVKIDRFRRWAIDHGYRDRWQLPPEAD